MTQTFLKVYLPIFLLLYLLATFVIPSWRVFKSTGINPVTFGKSNNAHDYIGACMKAVTASLAVSVLLFAFSDQLYSYLLPINFLQKQALMFSGFLLLHIALVWIIIAQNQMRNSWRIGIDENNKTALVTTGIFRHSRNPVFLGMIAGLLGMFFVLPNMITLLVLTVSYILIQIQIRLEEDFLFQQHGAVYRSYQQKVRRML